MTVEVFVLLLMFAAFVVFVIAAWMSKNLVAAGLALMALAFAVSSPALRR